jgi:hypothetical protein
LTNQKDYEYYIVKRPGKKEKKQFRLLPPCFLLLTPVFNQMRKYPKSNLLKSGSFLRIFANFCKFLRISVIFCDFLPPILAQLALLIDSSGSAHYFFSVIF